MKKRYLLYLLICCLIPTAVLANSSSGSIFDDFSFFIYAPFISLFHLVFIVLPITSKGEMDTAFKSGLKTYIILVIINILGCIILQDTWFFISFFSVFVIGFPVMFIGSSRGFYFGKKVTDPTNIDPAKLIKGYTSVPVVIKCLNCKSEIKLENKFCPNCGAEIKDNNIKVEGPKQSEQLITIKDMNILYAKSEDDIIKSLIDDAIKKQGFEINSKLVPKKEKSRFIVLDIIFSILVFLFIGLVFYHVDYYIYLIGLIILVLFYFKKEKFDINKYLIKEIKARPEEQIENIVGATKEFLVPKFNIISKVVLPILVVIGSLILFKSPHIFYEELEDGYAMRFYFTGWDSLTKASIPEEYNGKKVISLRGNAFSNMPLLKEVTIPESVYEIRGQAFKNDYSLKKVNLPKGLKYLGGESFQNCISLEDVNLEVDTPLDEIKGNTFEGCKSLKEITVPDSVTRIGGHAFYNAKSLSEVYITENSQLTEIGSSAFRLCSSLKRIKIPAITSVNSKAFKESPTSVSRYGESTDYTDDYYSGYGNYPDDETTTTTKKKTTTTTKKRTLTDSNILYVGDKQTFNVDGTNKLTVEFVEVYSNGALHLELSGVTTRGVWLYKDLQYSYSMPLDFIGYTVDFYGNKNTNSVYVHILQN